MSTSLCWQGVRFARKEEMKGNIIERNYKNRIIINIQCELFVYANGEKGQFLMQLFGRVVKIRNQIELKVNKSIKKDTARSSCH